MNSNKNLPLFSFALRFFLKKDANVYSIPLLVYFNVGGSMFRAGSKTESVVKKQFIKQTSSVEDDRKKLILSTLSTRLQALDGGMKTVTSVCEEFCKDFNFKENDTLSLAFKECAYKKVELDALRDKKSPFAIALKKTNARILAAEKVKRKVSYQANPYWAR